MESKFEDIISYSLFKPNATLNSLYMQYKKVIDDQPIECKIETPVYDEPKILEYNALGKIAIRDKPSYNVIRVIHHSISLKQLLRTIYELKIAGVNPDLLDSFKSNDDIAKKYSGFKAYWEEDTTSIGLKLGLYERCNFKIKIQEWNESVEIK